ncbi:hypothetical protein [Catellatospora chokoriensis]|uniref:Uncharacterized protein n=1 Tax=Catellatospora chokoriensis TaxID=310353 RepID=A0A8J3JW85_9ACTN|nr:hypothetical protein [Catellatospora chokoriensis]GIF88012.1 hypothetical protein Cch02nite_14560 [Catellatospora chokoriensis]
MTAQEKKQPKSRISGPQLAFAGVVLAALIGVTPALLDRLLPDDTPTGTGSPPPPSASGSPSPVAFTLTSAVSVPQCADITGYGTKPQGREVGLFIQVPGDTKYYWEKVLKFDGDSWRADRVVIGAPGDAGKEFNLVLVPLSVQAVVEFSKHDGTAYAVDNPPVAPITQFRVTRTTDLGSC